jgi:parallel beta-helix repeat protein
MNRRVTSLGSLFGLLLVLGLAAVPATAIAFDRFVNPFATCAPELLVGKPTHDTIQDAVDAAAAGDLIGVCPGTYPEAVTVATNNLTIRPTGASAVNVVGPGPFGPSFGFDVRSDGVTILGFEISGFGDDETSCGIRVTGENVKLTRNDVHDNAIGVCLISAIAGLVTYNRIHDNSAAPIGPGGDGMFIFGGRDNAVIANRVLDNAGEGINDVATHGSLLQQNIVEGNGGHGIISNSSVYARLTQNTARNNAAFGLMIHFSWHAMMDHNVATDGPEGGILASSSHYCTVSLNRASGNPGFGFGVVVSSYCLVDGNRAVGNGQPGFALVGLGEGNVVTRNVATNNGPPDCQWDGSDAPTFLNNTCTTEAPPGAWD